MDNEHSFNLGLDIELPDGTNEHLNFHISGYATTEGAALALKELFRPEYFEMLVD